MSSNDAALVGDNLSPQMLLLLSLKQQLQSEENSKRINMTESETSVQQQQQQQKINAEENTMSLLSPQLLLWLSLQQQLSKNPTSMENRTEPSNPVTITQENLTPSLQQQQQPNWNTEYPGKASYSYFKKIYISTMS